MKSAGQFPIAEGGMPPPAFELPAGWEALLGSGGLAPAECAVRALTVGISTASALKFPWHNRVSRSANSGKELIGNPMAGAKACAYHDTRSTLWRVTRRDDDH
jgi:hypothetical protein